MNDRVKAILLTALRLPPEERQALASALMDHLETDPDEAERLFAETDVGETKPGLPATDVLAKYLDT